MNNNGGIIMKAKRILSLLLTVAMIATIVSAFGMTAFAAPTGNDDYVLVGRVGGNFTDKNNAGVEALQQEVDANAAKADPDQIKADITITPATDEEIDAAMGYGVRADWGFGEEYKGYYLKISLANLGTLYSATSRGKQYGYKISSANVTLTPVSGQIEIIDKVSSDSSQGAFGKSSGGDYLFYLELTADASKMYPTTAGQYVDAAMDDFITVAVYATDDTVLEATAAYIGFSNYFMDGNNSVNTGFLEIQYPVWMAGEYSFVEGEEEPPVLDPEVGAAVAEDTDGVDIINGDRAGKKYDNAFAVTTSFENVDSVTGVGVLFIPKAVIGNAEVTAETADVADAYKEGPFLGGGSLTIRAAIKDIPRALQDQDLEMVARPYLLVGSEYTYGNAITETINFADTGE